MPNIKVSPPSAASRVSVKPSEATKKDVNNEKLMVIFLLEFYKDFFHAWNQTFQSADFASLKLAKRVKKIWS